MLISVTIPVYNNIEGLKISVKSLLNQRYTDWEAVVIDDGSTGNQVVHLEDFSDPRIRIHTFEKNRGRPEARQKSFELLRGQFCAFLDAGDILRPDFLENVHAAFVADPGLFAVSQSMEIWYGNESFFTEYTEGTYPITSPLYDSISFASTVFKSDVVTGFKFNEKLKYSQDRDFLETIKERFSGDIALVNSHSYIYDQGDNMKTRTVARKFYYDCLRLWTGRRYVECVKSVLKGSASLVIVMLFGYKKLLKLRHK